MREAGLNIVVKTAVAAALVLGAGVMLVAQERITNAKTETASASQGLAREITRVGARQGATWVGYRVPMAPGERRLCEGLPSRVFLESSSQFIVLARLENGSVVRLRTFTPECEVDAGGMSLVWLADVKPEESVAWLATLVTKSLDMPLDTASTRDRLVMPGIVAIAQHESSAAVPALVAIVRGTRAPDVRTQGIRWLARSKDPRALAFFEDVLTPSK